MTRAGLLLLALVVPAAGQERPQPEPPHIRPGGSEYFRFALYRHKIQPLSQITDASGAPGDTMIVILGDVTLLDLRLFRGPALANYINAGGAVLLATNGPIPGPGASSDWADWFGVRIPGSPVTADPRHSFQEDVDRPLVQPLPPVNLGGPSPFDLFKDVEPTGPKAVATDRPSEMSVIGANKGRFLVFPLAMYPASARSPAGRPLPRDRNTFAASIKSQQFDQTGRMIVVANRDAFTNGIIQDGFVKDATTDEGYRLDNGNWAFINRTIDWLQDGRVKRTKCLFIHDGKVIDRFATEFPNTNPPIPDIPPDVIANWLLNSANPIINEAQKKDVFNRFLERWLGLPRLVRMFLIAVTIVFVIAGLRWLARAGRKTESAAVMTPYTQATLLPRGGVLRQRTASQIEVGNLYEAARRRVRERFDVLGGRPGAAGQMPPVLTANDLPDGPVLYHSVRWLWNLGYGETPVAIPPADWDRTNVLLERVTARAARGDWSFGQDV